MSPRSWKNVARSVTRSTPVTRRSAPSSGVAPRPSTRIPMPVGRISALSARPSRNELSRCGASRKSSALRDGGVSSTSRSNSCSWSRSYSFAIAVNSWDPETAVDSSRYTRLALISSARSGVGAARSINSSKVRFGSSIIAHSSPSISSPPLTSRSGSTRRGSLWSCSRPSAFASRFAGSIVTTATFAPCAAMPSAIAAEVVVLPTPPDPAHTQIRLPSSI